MCVCQQQPDALVRLAAAADTESWLEPKHTLTQQFTAVRCLCQGCTVTVQRLSACLVCVGPVAAAGAPHLEVKSII